MLTSESETWQSVESSFSISWMKPWTRLRGTLSPTDRTTSSSLQEETSVLQSSTSVRVSLLLQPFVLETCVHLRDLFTDDYSQKSATAAHVTNVNFTLHGIFNNVSSVQESKFCQSSFTTIWQNQFLDQFEETGWTAARFNLLSHDQLNSLSDWSVLSWPDCRFISMSQKQGCKLQDYFQSIYSVSI